MHSSERLFTCVANPIDVAAYERDGYALLGKVFDDALIARLIAEEARFANGPALAAAGNAVEIDVAGASQMPRIRPLSVITQLMHRCALIRAVAVEGPQIAALRSIMGDDICLTHQQFVTKTPDARTPDVDVPWHQDNGFGQLDPTTDVTVWFTLNDCTASSGCLWVVPGSHKRGLLPHVTIGRLRGIAPGGEEGTPLPMRAGEAVAFSGLLVHGSKANRGNAPRHAFYLRYCEPQTRMVSLGGKPVLEDGYSWMVSGEAG